jgi:hypothetical protein
MQRMLALPVSTFDEPGHRAAATEPSVPHEAGALGPEAPARERSAPPSLDQRALVESPAFPRTEDDFAAGPVRPVVTSMRVPAARSAAEHEEAAAPAVGSPPVADSWPMALRPLVWINQAFDLLVAPCGPFGRWLGSPAGRAVLGGGGLLLLAGALTWGLLDWFGWTW